MKKGFIFLATVVLSTVLSINANAQVEKFKALYIYNISRFVEWPADYGSAEFTIGIVGNNADLVSNIETLLGTKNVNGKKIKVVNVSSAQDAEGCNILYFSKGKEKMIAEIGKGASKGLIITETAGATEHGSGINFFLQDSKLKFEMSQANITGKGLNISKELSSLASRTL